ncbi:hypothetical protein [Shouchella miscanthi]|nr:hypothetical protein [Shouchella miscanthi]
MRTTIESYDVPRGVVIATDDVLIIGKGNKTSQTNRKKDWF